MLICYIATDLLLVFGFTSMQMMQIYETVSLWLTVDRLLSDLQLNFNFLI